MAVSPDLFRSVYFQGHPEYDAISLLKEYKREVYRYLNGELDSAPPFPENYLPPAAKEVTAEFIQQATTALNDGGDVPPFPEAELTPHVDNTWGDTGKAIINNWLGLVYQLTNLDRKLQFMPGVDPEDPLGLK
jgi:homoserine O-succinyltransferase